MKIMTWFVGVLVTLAALNVSAAEDCNMQLEANDRMQYSTKTLNIATTCSTVTLTLTHTGKLPISTMGHNVVIAEKQHLDGLVADSFKAGIANRYVQPDDPRVIAASKVIGGGESTSITFNTDVFTAGKEYVFFCAAPGHWVMMQGTLHIQ